MSSSDTNLGEQAISKLVEEGIKAQLDQVESLSVDIKTDPIKLTQGQVERVLIKGTGWVVKDDLRTEELVLETGAVDIAMLKIPLGEIELEHPTAATAQVSLKPEDVQTAFNAGYVRQKLRGQKISLSGETVTTDASNVLFTVPESGRVAIAADVMLMEKVETHHIAFSAKPKLVDGGFGVALEDVEYDDEQNDLPELTQALIDNTQSLLDLRFFELDGMTLQFEQMTVEPEKITIRASAEITAFG